MICMKFGEIDLKDSMYPTHAWLLNNNKGLNRIRVPHTFYTLYGFVYRGLIKVEGDRISKNQFFSFPFKNSVSVATVIPNTVAMVICRLGYQGQSVIGTNLDEKGRLSYIDGCSDSILVYPPRKGDPSLNYLYFPEETFQTFHTHPSIRIGMVIKGNGYSWGHENDQFGDELLEGTMFALEAHEKHRFSTRSESMKIIAFHPDGDFGPTDEYHSMINRTYVGK